MAYFPNSTSGEILDNQCGECPIPHDAPCPILFVQMTYNYEQIDKDGKRNILSDAMNLLINEDGQCQMKPLLKCKFVDKNQIDLF